MDESFANTTESETIIISDLAPASELASNPLINQETELEVLMEITHQLEEYPTNDNQTNPIPTFPIPGTSANSQPPSPNDPWIPMICSGQQSYQCSWHLHDSGVRCEHVAPDRPAFLHHLGEKHQVSGDPGTRITCQLLDPKTGSACQKPRKRGNFPRHVDTHYPVRYYCQHCPTGKSFSRKDSWKKHIRNKHP